MKIKNHCKVDIKGLEMEKALKLLKILRDDYIHGELDKDINEAIAELQEAMKPKTCEGCRYGAFGVNGLGFEVECRIGYNCSRGREDRYEPKEQL